jgi:hypothetical protein
MESILGNAAKMQKQKKRQKRGQAKRGNLSRLSLFPFFLLLLVRDNFP